MKMNLQVKIDRLDAVIALLAANDIVKELKKEHPYISELEELHQCILEAGDAFRLEEVKDFGVSD